jgi:acetyl-CoA carboxylase biotin carboxyl carrier protein
MSDQDAMPTEASSGSERDRENQKSSETQPTRNTVGRERERHSRRRHQSPTQQQQSRRPAESMLPMDELRDLVELIGEHGFTDFEFERQDFRVRLRRDIAPQIIQGTPNAGAPAASQTAPPTSSQTSTSITPPANAAETSATQSAAASSSTENAQAASAPGEEEKLHIITSPIVGTFYRSASPTSEPFLRIGSHVSPETTVCIIEAMKLMNEIQAETSGEVVKIHVENAQPVEYGQPLFGIRK